MSEELAIPPTRWPRVRVVLKISAPLRKWLSAQAEDEAARDGGRPSMAAVLERVIREAANRR